MPRRVPDLCIITAKTDSDFPAHTLGNSPGIQTHSAFRLEHMT